MEFKAIFKLLAAPLLLGTAFAADGAAPSGYYQQAENKSGKNLLVALKGVISAHTTVSYKGLPDLYKTTDATANGKVWDMYSTKEWNFGETCGNYKNIGDCWNREHSFPKSWFDDKSPMYSDAFHIYPTDGKVNGQRSNFPYGECANGTYVATHNGIRALGKLGSCTFPGYSGKVFEPDDEYKGDFARSYFYMAACYNDRISTWSSPMLSGNNYPAFTTWAVNLLLKWHRQDPVSEKEIKRNDAVYARQKNRNPFIDYPELAEHIWGDKQSVAWTTTGSAETLINKPANGSSIDMGTAGVGFPLTQSVAVRTTNATTDVTLATTSNVFTVTPTKLSASQANAGANVEITFKAASAGQYSSTLVVTAGKVKSTASLTCNAVSGLPAGPAKYISPGSFTATWTYVGDADAQGNYTLSVSDSEGLLDGYPRKVKAQTGEYLVDGLEATTKYTYIVESEQLQSQAVEVVTAEAVPMIEFTFDGDLYFTSSPGEPSIAAEIFVDWENINDNISISVGTPFELSTDKSNWGSTITLAQDEDRIYLRLNSQTEGTFRASLIAKAGNYTSESVIVEGAAISAPEFFEDFEAEGEGSYNPYTYYGDACVWNFNDVGIWPNAASDKPYSGEQALRFGKNANSYIEMAEDRLQGIGIVTFYAKGFNTDSDATLDLQVSTDGGITYTTAATVTVKSSSTYSEYKAAVNRQGKVRLRIQQTTGKRFIFDALSISNSSSGVDEPLADRHMWDAFATNGMGIIEVLSAQGIDAAVYAVDGRTIFIGHLENGRHELPLEAGYTLCPAVISHAP